MNVQQLRWLSAVAAALVLVDGSQSIARSQTLAANDSLALEEKGETAGESSSTSSPVSPPGKTNLLDWVNALDQQRAATPNSISNTRREKPGAIELVTDGNAMPSSQRGATTPNQATIAASPSGSAGEDKPLGKPNGALNARPVSDDTSKRSNWTLGTFGEAGRVAGALAVVIGIALLLRTILVRTRRGLSALGGDRPSGVLEILARFPIARGQQLLVLKLGRRLVLTHHAGATMQSLCEVSDPDEVASLLGRMEAGSSGASADRFREVLAQFHAEHDRLNRANDRPRRGSMASAALLGEPPQVVDLTRSRSVLGGLLGRRRNS